MYRAVGITDEQLSTTESTWLFQIHLNTFQIWEVLVLTSSMP